MPQMMVNLIKGDKIGSNTDYRDALPINMYAVRKDILGAKGYMLCFPGLSKVADSFGIDRAGVYNERFKKHYRVSDQKFCCLETDGTVTELGTISGNLQASMPYSFNTQAIIADGKLWLYDATNGFREVTDSDLGNPIDGVWVNGRYFMTDGEYIYHTDITDESSIDPLKYATAEFMPDPSLGVAKTQDNKVIVFGRYTLEYFVDVETENFAFQRVETRAQKIGIVATHAKCEANGKWFITGGRKEESLGVHIIGVGASQKISTREIDKILKQYNENELINMRMESRSEEDTTFIYVHLPSETLVYNAGIAETFGNSVAWSILKIGSENLNYRGINGVFDANLGYWVYGDKLASILGHLDNTVFTQYDEKQEWYLYPPFINIESASIDEIEIETIPGHNIVDDATVAFSLTYDGETYSQEWWDLYSEINNRSIRYIQRRLGYVPSWVGFRFRGLTTSRMAFSGMTLTYG
jgi:hypothetical protein